MLSMLRTTLASTAKFVKSTAVLKSANFHTLSSRPYSLLHSFNGALASRLNRFLRPQNHSFLLSCGFKVMGKVRRRCKDCYLVRRQERLYNLCKTHPRHKQMSMVKHEKNTWILTHATQSKVRPW